MECRIPFRVLICKGMYNVVRYRLYIPKEVIHYYLERISIVHAIFLDKEKAFDSVGQDGLFYKLNLIGIHGKLWNPM